MFGFLMPCWYSYSYDNNRYIFGQGDMTCLRSSKRTLEPSKTKYPLGKHPNNLMPYKIIPRYGIGASMEENEISTKQYVHRSTSTQGNGTNELWYTIAYDYLFIYSFVCLLFICLFVYLFS